MNLFDLIFDKRLVQLSFKLLVKLRDGDTFVIAPPGQLSYIFNTKKSFYKIQFRSDQFNILSPINFNEIECKFFFTVVRFLNQNYILSGIYFIEETIANYFKIIQDKIIYHDIFDILNYFSIKEVLKGFGYITQVPIETNLFSIRDFLSAKSNDYSLLDFIWKKIFNSNINNFDVSEIVKRGFKFNDLSSISIIIPCYKSNSTIINSVESILYSLSQLPNSINREIIIVNDSETLNLKFENKSIKIISSNYKLHCGGARNLGLAAAKGDILFLLDSDIYIAPNYISNHLLRHIFFPNLITVSMREQITENEIPSRHPKNDFDTRCIQKYSTEWKTLNTISKSITVMPLKETDNFKNFGFGKKLGPTDLPFMVKGNNVSFYRKSIANLLFCNKYEGWGPEDVSFAANLISKGFFVLPILSTGVFHVKHTPRSGSDKQKEIELEFNLKVHDSILNSHPYDIW